MSFKELLTEKLNGKIAKEKLRLLPRGFQAVGGIIILNLDKELNNKEKIIIGNAILEIFPRIKNVCNKIGEIKGEFRKPQIEILVGKETETIHIENNCKYKLDARKLMFAKGNVNERVRIARQIKAGEIVVDMFAGLGYFSVPIAKLSLAKKIYAIEKNPEAFSYLKENIKLNNISNIEAILGDCKKEALNLAGKGVKADRIVMGYLPPPKSFLPFAFKIAGKGTIIHYETLLLEDKLEKEAEKNMKAIEKIAEKFGLKIKLLSLNYVKSYKPRVNHYVLDILVS